MAYRDLLDQRCAQFLVEPRDFVFPDDKIVIMSIQEYGELSGLDPHWLIRARCHEGYVYRNYHPGRDLILYNEEINVMRMRFTIAHEIAHCRLKHRIHGRIEEAQAHLYACQLLAPDVVLWRIRKMGHFLTPQMIASMCGLSMPAAEIKNADYQNCRKLHTEYDEQLVSQWNRYLIHCFRFHYRDCLDILAT